MEIIQILVAYLNVINRFVSKSEKQIKVSFTEISKLDFIAYCVLMFKFVHNGNYLNYYEICKCD